MSFSAAFGGFQTTTEGTVPVSVAMNSDVALECDVDLSSTNPPPEIVWRFGNGSEVTEMTMHNKRRFLENRRFLYIREVVASDLASTYRCEVTNAFLDLTVQAPMTYELFDNLTQGQLIEYKPIGELTAFVGETNFEVSYVTGYHSTGTANGTNNRVFLGGTEITDPGSIGLIDVITPPTGDFIIRADVRFDSNSEDKFGMLRIRRKSTCWNVNLNKIISSVELRICGHISISVMGSLLNEPLITYFSKDFRKSLAVF